MTVRFEPCGAGALVGSLPLRDHDEATRAMLTATPEIPAWVQLPCYPQEGMINQFLPGFPGIAGDVRGKVHVDTASASYHDDLAAFYEDYLAVCDNAALLPGSRFALSSDTAPGFFSLRQQVAGMDRQPLALKGQVTGPVTLGMGLKDTDGRSVIYDETLCDVMIKHLAMKACWQVQALGDAGVPVIVFFDEPGIVSIGTSACISISREQVLSMLGEVMGAVTAAGGVPGIHICANADWSLAFEAGARVISFDAYSYFDRFILYPDQLRRYLQDGGILAWGIVPTSDPEFIRRETPESLFSALESHIARMEQLGLDRARILRRSIITPSCGAGSLSVELASRVLAYTSSLSGQVRGLVSR